MNLSPVYIEISQSALKALRESEGFETALERSGNGRLTPACKDRVTDALQRFIGRKSWQPRIRAHCAISASGVSLRRLSLPASNREEFDRLLRLQIETEFPLPPEQLAWGWRPIPPGPTNGAPATRDVLVAALRKEILDEYTAILAAAGAAPIFTLAALARHSLCPAPNVPCAVLDVGSHQSELAAFDGGIPGAVRILPCGADHAGSEDPDAVDALARSIRSAWTGNRLYLSGAPDLAPQLASRLGNGADCVPLPVTPGAGRSAAVLGLRKSAEQNNGTPLLVLGVQPKTTEVPRAFSLSHPAVKRWAPVAAVLLVIWLALPYAEALLLEPRLTQSLSAIESDKDRLGVIDRELNFLQYLGQNQPPYLDAMHIVAKAAPSGMRIESLTMNRRGEVSLRGSIGNSDQVVEFRSKLIASGFFANVSVEEQVPTSNRQQLNVRIAAQWKSHGELAALSIGPTDDEIETARVAKEKGSSAAPPGPMPPGVFPSGAMPPGTIPIRAIPPRP